MNEYVFGFDISMNDISIFEEFQSNNDLSDKPANNLIGKPLLIIEYKVLQSTFITILYK